MITTPSPTWQTANQQHLATALAGVRTALQQYLARAQGQTSDEGVAAPEVFNSDFGTDPAALTSLCAAFHLTSFERDLLLLCAGVELSGSLAQLCSEAQGGKVSYPTFSLALAALPDAHWSALTPASSLRYWRLIEVANGESLTQSRLRIDERVLHYLNGLTYLDDRLRGLVEPMQMTVTLPTSHQQLAMQIANLGAKGESCPIIQLTGEGDDDKEAIAAAACNLLGLQLYRLAGSNMPGTVAEREAWARLWEREAILSRSALLVDGEGLDRDRAKTVVETIATLNSLVMVSSPEPIAIRQRSTFRIDVPRPSTAEQRQLWQQGLGVALRCPEPVEGSGSKGELAVPLAGQIDRVVAHFNLGSPLIQGVCDRVRLWSNGNQANLSEFLWESCRSQARTRLDDLAQRIEPMAGWDDLILPVAQQSLLREVAAQIKQRSMVYDTWEFARRGANGLGIAALFAGASGTGKTLAAEVLARELQLDLYRIDLSQVVSKYIGETEKNLRRVFTAAEAGGAILLFDEADALFGKRSEVKDSHDRYANIEVSYLLQRMEAYRGLAILTTNLRGSIDSAFLRRIRFVIQFPFPDVAQRLEIWRRMFPPKLPTAGLDWDKLARLNITGGNIRNIVLNAAFLAADEGEPVQMKHLLRSAQGEYTKLEKTLTDVEVGGWI
jgi:ATPase family associated with various cellular activities (AAA)